MENSFESGTSEEFLNLLKNPKECRERVKEALDNLHGSQEESFFRKLNDAVRRSLLSMTPHSAQEKENVALDETTQKNVAEALQGLISLLINSVKDKDAPFRDLYPVIYTLYGSINELNSEKVKNLIVQLCEIWWHRNFEKRETVVVNVVFYLIQKSLKKNLKSDIKRVYKLINCLKNVCLNKDEIDILSQCVTSDLFLGCPEGRRFIATTLQLSPSLFPLLHKNIKIKLVEYNSKNTVAFGEIYFSAWRSSQDDEICQVIEEKGIQDFMFHCIHGSSERLTSNLRKLLGVIHQNKTQKAVGKMLFKLYQPILFRSLKVANAIVRANAAALLFLVFPLVDPEENNIQRDVEIERQLFDAESLLMDPFHRVREIAILGVCSTCRNLWDVLSVERIKSLLTPLVKSLAFDMSAVSVRVAVYKGLTLLLENVMTHNVMKVLLRSLESAIFDPSEHVCLAFLDMLLALKGRRTIKFWDITPPDQLLLRLDDASPNVAKRIITLLMDSYHPLKKDDNELFTRSLCLINSERDPIFMPFYLHLARLIDVSEIARYLLIVHNHVKLYVNNIIKNAIEEGEMEFYEDPNKEVELEEDTAVTDVDIQIESVKRVIEAATIMWAARRADLQENVKLSSTLNHKYSSSMTRFMKVFRNTVAIKPLVYLSSFIPPSKVPFAVSYCLSQLKLLTADSSEDDYSYILESLCNWGRGEEMIETITRWLQSALSFNASSSPMKKKRKNKCVRFEETTDNLSLLALDMLTYVLVSPVCSKSLLTNNRDSLVELFNALRSSQKLLEQAVYNRLPQNHSISQELLLRSFFRMFELGVHLCDKDREPLVDINDYLSKLLMWVDDKIIPKMTAGSVLINESLNRSHNQGNSYAVSITWALILSVLQQLCAALLTNICNMDLVYRIANLMGVILSKEVLTSTDESDQVITWTLRVIWRMEYFCLRNKSGDNVCVNIIPSLLKSFINRLATFSSTYHDKFAKQIEHLKLPLRELLSNSQRYAFLNNSLHEVVKVIVDVNVADMSRIPLEVSGCLKFNISERPLTSFLCSHISQQPLLTKKYLEELKIFLKSQQIENTQSTLLTLCLIGFFIKKGKAHHSMLKQMISIVEKRVNDMQNLPKETVNMDLEILRECLNNLQESFDNAQ